LFARRRRGVVVVDEPFECFLQRRPSKIYEQSKGRLCQAQVRQKLLSASGIEPLDLFDFDQDALVDEQINAKGCFEPVPFELMSIGFSRSTEYPISISFPASRGS
jgi:hypothetical protein